MYGRINIQLLKLSLNNDSNYDNFKPFLEGGARKTERTKVSTLVTVLSG